MQSDHVAFTQYGFEGGITRPHRCGTFVLGEQHFHAERQRDLFHRLADRAVPHDAQRRRVQVAHRMREQAELRRFLPLAAAHVGMEGEQVAAQSQHQHEHVLRHGVHRVIADVGYHDAVFAAVFDIHVVGAGRSDGDHLQLRQLLQRFAPQQHLVGDGDGGVLQPRHDLIRRRGRIRLPFMREGRTPHFGDHSG